MRRTIVYIILCILAIPVTSRAQIGYQVSLLNTATGEPRAGVTVSAAVTITDSSDKVVYTGTQQATTNDFGVLSLAVGDDATFKNVDWSKLPFFISVTVDGMLVGKSQILSVPVAEYAKKTGELTKEMLVGTWVSSDESFIFHDNGKCECNPSNGGEWNGEYYIDGNTVCLIGREIPYYFDEIMIFRNYSAVVSLHNNVLGNLTGKFLKSPMKSPCFLAYLRYFSYLYTYERASCGYIKSAA